MFRLRRQKQGFEVVISAVLAEVDRVCREVADFLVEHGLDGVAFDVLLGVRETLCNAILHGSGKDPAKEVRLRIVLKRDCLLLKVIDQGPGFDWRGRPGRLAKASDTSGRGLSMLNIYFDRVQHNQLGNEIELMKKITN